MKIQRKRWVDKRDQAAARTDQAWELGEVDEYRNRRVPNTGLACDSSILG
jgi:hypothetical protein